MKLVVIALASLAPSALASQAEIAGYAPGSDVTDHNALDKDVAMMGAILKAGKTSADFVKAYNVYSKGGHSRSEAKFAGTGMTEFPKGLKVVQAGTGNEGKIYKDSSTTLLRVRHSGPCEDGANGGGIETGVGDVSGCFDNSALTITLADGTEVTQAVDSHVNAYRTMKGFSVGGDAKMTLEPYFIQYSSYYAQPTSTGLDLSASTATAGSQYAHAMVESAYAKTGAFAAADELAQYEGIMKGSVYMNAFMYTIHEMEDAIDDCTSGCTDCNDDPVHAWDEAVAFYTGSNKGIYLTAAEDDAADDYGVMGFALAEKRCVNFGTCNDGTDKKSGSKANTDIFELFNIGLNLLNKGECHLVIPVKDAIVQKMSIPLIQGTMRYANKVSVTSTTRGTTDKSLAEGFVFASSVVPLVNNCRRTDAKTIEASVDLAAGRAGLAYDQWDDVKAAFENNYECMNITCSDVGTLYSSVAGEAVENGEACTFKIARERQAEAEALGQLAKIVIGVAAAAVLLFAGLACYCQNEKKKTLDRYNDLAGGGKGAPAVSEMA